MIESHPPVWSLPEALEELGQPHLREKYSVVGESPLFIVDLPPSWPDTRIRDAAVLLRQISAVACPVVALAPRDLSVGMRSLADCFDAVVESAADLAAIERTVHERPLASLALVQLLRHTLSGSLEQGLVAESLAYSTLQGGPEFCSWRASRRAKDVAVVDSVVSVSRDACALHIELNRPDRHNAFSRAMRDELCEALLLGVADDEIEQIELSGRGPSFCSGGDLDEFGSFPDPAQAHAIRMTRSPARLMATLSDRLNVRVHGACMGAGIELPAFARHVCAREDAYFELPESALGLVPGAGGTVSLPRRIGRQAMLKWALTGARLDAETALRIGLIDEIEGS